MIFSSKNKGNEHVYQLTWITPQLAAGHAPMTTAELDSIKKQGIRAIMNLCVEIKELPGIEKEHGFEVYCLPIVNEGFPEIEDLDRALDWLDECIYLGKKVLVHCRHGIGRTGTVIFSYLLRKGLDTKSAAKMMRGLRARPTEHPQKRFLHLYGKKEKPLKIFEPSLVPGFKIELTPWLGKTGVLLEKAEKDVSEDTRRCGKDHDRCCRRPIKITLAESVYLQSGINTELTSEKRREITEKALDSKDDRCPLLKDRICILYAFRPLRCRTYDLDPAEIPPGPAEEIQDLSEQILKIFFGKNHGSRPPELDLSDVVSGKFVQKLFKLMSGPQQK